MLENDIQSFAGQLVWKAGKMVAAQTVGWVVAGQTGGWVVVAQTGGWVVIIYYPSNKWICHPHS